MNIILRRTALGATFFISLALFVVIPGFTRAITFPSVADLDPGDLIKSSSSSTVYYFGADEMRYGFPNEKTFFTWYDDFYAVETIALSEMNMIPLGGMVTYKPQFGDDLSTRLLKTQLDSTVYVPVGNGMLAALKNTATAKDLFGTNWASYVDDLPEAFVPLYTILGGNLTSDSEFVAEYTYTISDDLEIYDVTGVMMYSDPLRFAASDESKDCGQSYCSYNEVTVEKGATIKFINYTGEDITVREASNRWTTGKMESEDIAVLTIDDRAGTYYFYADEDDDMMGMLTVE